MSARGESRLRRKAYGVFAAAALLASCASGSVTGGTDGWIEPITLTDIGPNVVVPGSVITIEGENFVHPDFGQSIVHLIGEVEGRRVDFDVPAEYVDEHKLQIAITSQLLMRLGTDDGHFVGGARVEVDNAAAGRTQTSNAINLDVELRPHLEPRVDWVATGSRIFINDGVQVEGDGFLFGGGEGQTLARVWGCFHAVGTTECMGVEPVEIPVEPEGGVDRTRGTFRFAPQIVGIRPGVFRGSVQFTNEHGAEAGGMRFQTDEMAIELTIDPPVIRGVSAAGSLGQYVDIEGGGFVGVVEEDDGVTVLEVTGSFTSSRTGSERAVDVLLVPELRSGRVARYVLAENDALGEAINLRREHGVLSGTITPVVRHRDTELRGQATPFSFEIRPLRQVIFLAFQPSYIESLRHFGLRALEGKIRRRILDVVNDAYSGVAVEWRTELPDDFALYSHVDLAGRDPNGQGLFGYDNTPGKDTNNERLHDRIGGVNAATQQDGYPGYGGVFIESFFGFSPNPGKFVDEPLDGATPIFDRVFDPFRPDRGGRPVDLADVERGFPDLTSGDACPAQDRPTQIACAVWVLANTIGSTLAHEVGHSLGLANPFGDGYHDLGDQPRRLMDAGGARPFEERAQLMGNGPELFCDEEYEYLRQIMPSGEEDTRSRPTCD